MRTKEQRAQTARENGAKSRGPVTPEGKAHSRLNALKSGAHAQTLAPLLPPHSAVLCNENTREYAHLLTSLIDQYQPLNHLALEIVHSIAIARWELARLRVCLTMHWNASLLHHGSSPNPLAPELLEFHAMTQASAHLYSPNGPARQISRAIDQLELRIARLERRLLFTHKHFPAQVQERTQPESPEVAENTEPPIVITENKPAVLQAYKTLYPHRKIIIRPADNVANGIDLEDDMPTAPRKAA